LLARVTVGPLKCTSSLGFKVCSVLPATCDCENEVAKPGTQITELCEFQAKLTGEKVVLDISSVKLMKLSKAHSRSSETFSSVRVQIWHEEEGRRSTQSDVASFVTAGTTLSGPLRDRLVPSSSRLIVFLGRLDEYITVFSLFYPIATSICCWNHRG
jgi:hypothetical protein